MQLGSKKSRSASSSIVMVPWNVNWFESCSNAVSSNIITRLARINYFSKHDVTINGVNKTHLLTNLSWFLYHPKNTLLGRPITVWYHDLFEPCGIHSFILVQVLSAVVSL